MEFLIFWFVFLILFDQNIRCHGTVHTFISSKDDDALIVEPSSREIICNRINIYKSYQKCLCDQYCLKKNNCCPNNQYCMERRYRDDELTCVSTLYGDVRMVNTCLPNFEHLDAEYVRKCQTTDTEELIKDFLLSVPVTTAQNITYRNLFCAVCNNVPEYLIWNVAVRCEFDEKNPDSSKNINSKRILSELDIDDNEWQLISNVNGSFFKCFTQTFLPYGWTESLRFCELGKMTQNCSLCEKTKFHEECMKADLSNGVMFSLPLRNPYLPNNPSEELYGFIYENRDAISEAQRRRPNEYIAPEVHKCFPKYEENSLDCIVLIKKDNIAEFDYNGNQTIFVRGKYNASFGATYWNSTLDQNAVRFCSTKTVSPTTSTENILFQTTRKWIGVPLDILSFIFLIIFVMVNFSKKKTKLSNLPHKIIFSFSITLLPLYAVDRITFWKMPCTEVKSVFQHYSYLSLYTWLVIAAYEFWRFLCYLPERCQWASGESHLKRYFIYCVIGWISPLSVIGVALYYDSAPISDIPCDRKPAYGRTKSCFLQPKALPYFYFYPSTALFSIVILFFTYTMYYIYSRDLVENNTCAQNSYKVLVKLALGMGLPWTIDLLWIYTDITDLYALCDIVTAPLGIFIFFAYSFEKSMIRCQCMCKKEFGEMTPSVIRTTIS